MLRRVSMTSAILLTIGLILIACSRDERVVVAAGHGTGTQAEAKTQTVTIKGFKFEPETLTVSVGDSVEWKNADAVPHTATAEGVFDSKTIKPGGSWRFVAGKKGTFDYICSLHPNMKGTLIVQ